MWRDTGPLSLPPFTALVLLLSVCVGVGGVFQAERWLPPLNDVQMIRLLCTEQMYNHVVVEVQQMRDQETLARSDKEWKGVVPRAPIMGILRHYILCRKNFTELLSGRKYEGVIWFMRALDFCDINRIVVKNSHLHYTRDFQVDMLRAGFALVCQKTDDIGRLQLSAFADLFRIVYERHNLNRPIICSRLMERHRDLYGRCHVDATLANITAAETRCDGDNAQPIIKLRSFFSRFSRPCQTLTQFYQDGDRYDTQLGSALANDTVFMNMLGASIKRTVINYSLLPHLVLKTRLLLQHFPLAAIRMKEMIEAGRRCKLSEAGNINLDSEHNNSNHFTDHNSTDECRLRNIDDINTEVADDFVRIGKNAALGVFIELVLLCIVGFNTLTLSVLLLQTKEKLSTATILFIFNILFSNALFVASFGCMFSDFYDDLPYGGISEEQFYQNSAALIIAETLQTHLFAPSEFFKHLVQETLFSLAQNGSLLGLTHLLVLVLVVINKSMSGKAIKLSRTCVILVFAFVWFFLIVSHVIFSAMQFSAINTLDNLFSELQANPGSLECEKPVRSDFRKVGEHCDRVAVFHTFGVYLLRGHTLFTLTFLVTSTVVFLLTMLYHWRVRSQHDILSDNMRDASPHQRRETLFNTLLLSIGAFFISVLGQSFIEIAVFWVDDRHGVARLATFYQMARIASFADPVFNPILVAVRTPTIRRRLRHYFCFNSPLLAFLCCPWRTVERRRRRRTASSSTRKRSVAGCQRRGSSTTATADSFSGRPESVDSEVTLKLFCTGQRFRSSILRRSRNSSHNNSVI